LSRKRKQQFTLENHRNQFSGTGKKFTNSPRKALKCADNRSIKTPIYFSTDSSLNGH